MRCDGDERHELHLQTSESFVLRFNVFTEHLFNVFTEQADFSLKFILKDKDM